MPPGHARRRVLAVLAGACLAGCSTDSTTPTDTGTPSPTDTGTPTPSPGVVPPSRTFSPTAVAADGHALTAERWFALDAVRYETDDGHATVEPFGDRFVGYEFRLANRGDERRQALPDSVFRLRVAGETHDHVHALRGEVAFRRADQPADEPTIRPLRWYEGLAPGEAVRLQLVFDVPAHPAVRHYLAWHHRTAVEGSAEPAYLYP
ncbi:hypothetical protein [Halorarius halobius]|uniref:hypothetical protein n=1 Tax=Halorarius halobius TaxID=2962671 RepID=UPI0020CB90F5|nr:hypothetical protein [Halorarius halobius]